ncbi:MAG: hypothetical protein ACU0CI_00575 [Shimia sp.]
MKQLTSSLPFAPKLDVPAPGNIDEDFGPFRSEIAGLATDLGLQKAKALNSDILFLAAPTKELLLHKCADLRKAVERWEESPAKIKRVLSLIAQLESEIENDKLRYAISFKTIALISAAAVGSTSFLADAPDALATITQLIGLQQEAQDNVRDIDQIAADPPVPMLPPPPKQIAGSVE